MKTKIENKTKHFQKLINTNNIVKILLFKKTIQPIKSR